MIVTMRSTMKSSRKNRGMISTGFPALCMAAVASLSSAAVSAEKFYRLESATPLPKSQSPDWDYVTLDPVRSRLFIAQRGIVAEDRNFVDGLAAVLVQTAVAIVIANRVGGAEVRNPAGFEQRNQPRLMLARDCNGSGNG